MRRTRAAVAAAIVWVPLVLISGGSAQAALPIDLTVDLAEITLRGAQAQINVLLDAGATSTRLIASDSIHRQSRCEVQGNVIDCRAPADQPSNLVVDLVIGPRVSVVVEGRALDVAIGALAGAEAPAVDANSAQVGTVEAEIAAASTVPSAAQLAAKLEGLDEEERRVELERLTEQLRSQAASNAPERARASAASDFLPLEVLVVESQLYWSGRVGGTLRAETSNLFFEDTFGSLDLQLTTSTTEVKQHEGNLALTARGGRFTLDRQRGDMTLTAVGTTLELFGVAGVISGDLETSSLRLEEGAGKLQMQGRDSSFDLVRGGFGQGWAVDGERNQLRATQVQGAGTLGFVGGSLELEGTAQLQLTLSAGAEATARNINGAVRAEVADRSELVLENASGAVNVSVRDATLGVHGAPNLSLQAASSEVALSAIRRLAGWQMADTSLRADFTTLDGNSNLRLDGSSEAEVRLETPCFVRLNGRTTPLSRGLQVSGCEIMTPQHSSRMSRGALSRLDGGRGIVFGIDLDDGSSVRIQGNG